MMVTQSKAIEVLLSKTEKEKQTNFSRITASPEALAEFAEHFANCGDDCPVSNKNICEYKCKKCKEALLAWLKQESDTE